MKRLIFEFWTSSAVVGEQLVFTLCLGSSHGVITKSTKAEIHLEPSTIGKVVKGLGNGKISTGSNEIIIETKTTGEGLLIIVPEEGSEFPGIQIMFRVFPKPTDKRSQLEEGEEPTGSALPPTSETLTPPSADSAFRAQADPPPRSSDDPTPKEGNMTTPATPVNADSIGIIERISQALATANIDAAAGLYAEATELFQSDLLGAARDRLYMLLCLDPEDGEARLLLVKVFAGQQRWEDAQYQIDVASTLRVSVPRSLQDKVNAGLQAERDADPNKLLAELTRAKKEVKQANAAVDTARQNGYLEGKKDRGMTRFLISLLWLIVGAAIVAGLWFADATMNPVAVNMTEPEVEDLGGTEVLGLVQTPTTEAAPEPSHTPQSGCTGENNQSWTFVVGDKTVLAAVCRTDDGDEWHACWTDGVTAGSFDPNDPSSCVWMPELNPGS